MSDSLKSAELAQQPGPAEYVALEKRVRRLLVLYAFILIFIGLSTIPLQWEVALLEDVAGEASVVEAIYPALAAWISEVAEAVRVGYSTYPLLQYGTDWLAFAHMFIGIAFLGAARDPVRNVWVVEWGLIACVLVIPTALIFGAIRDIPLFWRLIDCSFGLFGGLPLWYARRLIHQLARPQRVA